MKIWIKDQQPQNEERVAELLQICLSNKKDISTPGPSQASSTQTMYATDLRRSCKVWNKQKTDAVKGENTSTKVEQRCFKCGKTGH